MTEIKIGEIVTFTATYAKGHKYHRGIVTTAVGIVEAIQQTSPDAIRRYNMMGKDKATRTYYRVAWETEDGRTVSRLIAKSNIKIAR